MAKAKVTTWVKNAIGYFWCNGNDMQQANQTAIFSSVFSAGNGFYITQNNLWQAAIVFSVRRLIKPTWLNDRDQFLQPDPKNQSINHEQANSGLPSEFSNDCLIWMLFNGSNLTASANNLEWNEQKWSIVNHFIPFTEVQVGAPERFESDFMVRYLVDKQLSVEAKVVLNEGLKLWQAYFAMTDDHTVRDALKLNRADVGWYQIRKALESRNTNGAGVPTDFAPFKTAYDALGDKLRPMVFELGFMK